MKSSTLVVCAHPDDEVLGCGGTIAKFAKQGAAVHVAFLADGVTSRTGDADTWLKKMNERRQAASKACESLGAKPIYFGEFPDNRMDTIALLDVVKVIEKLINDCQPNIILTHYFYDLNVDHRVVHDAVITACRPQRGHPVKTVLCFETPSSTEWQAPQAGGAFNPNWFSDISDTWNDKVLALEAYVEEVSNWPHPRSRQGIENLARWRGATIGVNMAEAFVVDRIIA